MAAGEVHLNKCLDDLKERSGSVSFYVCVLLCFHVFVWDGDVCLCVCVRRKQYLYVLFGTGRCMCLFVFLGVFIFLFHLYSPLFSSYNTKHT